MSHIITGNGASNYNQKLSPNELDTALSELKLNPKAPAAPSIVAAKNDKSQHAQLIQQYRDKVTIEYAGNWAQFFADWKKTQEREFYDAKKERAILHKQNQELLAKLDLQTNILEDPKVQIQRLIDELEKRVESERLIELRKEKRRTAKKPKGCHFGR